MKKKALTFLLLSVAATALVLSGCSWTQRGAAAGGAIGSGVAAGWGYSASAAYTVAELALSCGAAGAATGALIGDQFDQAEARKSDRELENLRAQLTERENELAQLRTGNDPRVAELESQIQQLSGQNQVLSGLAEDKGRLEAELAALKQANDGASNERIAQLENESAALREQIAAKEAQLNSLQTAVQEKATSVDALRSQLSELNVQLEETNRGLTLTILDQLLYKPGSASLSPEGKTLISRVADIIQQQFPGREIIVEGHTDDQPIKFSKWTSNWELGAARALTVVHTLVDEHGFNPTRISAMSFGEYRPAADNASTEGRSLNRRSVIVIMPENATFQKQVAAVSTP